MATPPVLAFDAEGRPVKFDTWLDDLHLFLQLTAKEDISLYDHALGHAPAPATDADSTTRSQWQTRDAHARFAIRNSLPLDEREHFGQHKTAQKRYKAVVARYSSPASAALGRLSLPYLFPDLASFHTVANLITHLRTSEARFRAAMPAEFLATDHFLARCPTELTIDLLEKELLAAEASIVAPLLLLSTSLVLRRSGLRLLRADAAGAKGAREGKVTAGEAVVEAVAAVGVVVVGGAGGTSGGGGGGGGSGGGGGRGGGGGGGGGGRGGGRGGGGRGGGGGGGGRAGSGKSSQHTPTPQEALERVLSTCVFRPTRAFGPVRLPL
ncbi:unnamed protein product [Closterium sp. Yama58-4]|nr:unnamed protein product [Closterium sp. Yama58-4]